MKWIEDVEFRTDGGDGIEAVLPDGGIVPGIRFVQLFPLRKPNEFISVIRSKNKEEEKQELGVIKNLAGLPQQQRELIRVELRRCFFLPEIESIRKVVTVGGIDELTVSTSRGDKTVFVCDRKQSIHVCDDGMILLTDMDKCRYCISHPERLDTQSKYLLERVMP